MKEFIPLNKNQIRKLIENINKDYNIKLDRNYSFFKSDRKFFMVSEEIRKIDLSKLNIKHIGLNIAEIKNNKLYLSKSALDLFLKYSQS